MGQCVGAHGVLDVGVEGAQVGPGADVDPAAVGEPRQRGGLFGHPTGELGQAEAEGLRLRPRRRRPEFAMS